MELLFQKAEGVVSTRVGYMGGSTESPDYRQVSYENTGHAEAIEVVYDITMTHYDTMARLFFEIHDPTQTDGQGPDIGSQYLSAIFVKSNEEQKIVQKLIKILEKKGLKVATKIIDGDVFYKAEDYHQDYYEQKGSKPYCHAYVKRF